MIFGHSFFCVGGVTIDGVIGIRDYPDPITYEEARKLYIEETRFIKSQLQLTDEQLANDRSHRLNGTYRGLYTYEKLMQKYYGVKEAFTKKIKVHRV